MNKIKKLFKESIKIKKEILNSNILDVIERMGDEISNSIKNGGKIMLCGNGGSAADAQHLAAEMLIRLRPKYNREGIPAITLAQDVSTITACGNDFGFDRLFVRTLESLGNPGDVLIAITTSGNSVNVIKAMQLAKKKKIRVFGFLGAGGGQALEVCDEAFLVPSKDTGRIQESHITAGHALMEYVEDKLLDIGYLQLD
tara:strand:- start:112 stop:708 length:597 start_codon:yes stop_codon:yes gene_type:complete